MIRQITEIRAEKFIYAVQTYEKLTLLRKRGKNKNIIDEINYIYF